MHFKPNLILNKVKFVYFYCFKNSKIFLKHKLSNIFNHFNDVIIELINFKFKFYQIYLENHYNFILDFILDLISFLKNQVLI